jgi:hypothetical protein
MTWLTLVLIRCPFQNIRDILVDGPVSMGGNSAGLLRGDGEKNE